jgi:hypothetical protein
MPKPKKRKTTEADPAPAPAAEPEEPRRYFIMVANALTVGLVPNLPPLKIHHALAFPSGVQSDMGAQYVAVVPEIILTELVTQMRVAAELSKNPKVEGILHALIERAQKLAGRTF